MRKVLTQSSTAAAYESVLLHPYRTSTTVTPDVSASSSLAEPASVSGAGGGGHAAPPLSMLLRYSNRPTFGISLNELKAAIAPRAERYQGSVDETDRFDSHISCLALQTLPYEVYLLNCCQTCSLMARYLVDDCPLVVSNVGRRRLWSAHIDTCIIPRTNTRLGDRSFAVAGPRLWNSLPAELRQPDIELEEFRLLLKSSLFT